METKEKAKDLVNKFWNINPIYLKLITAKNNPDYTQAKQFALIAVDEIIEATKIKQSNWEDRFKTNCKYEIIYSKYWQKVKNEIDKY